MPDFVFSNSSSGVRRKMTIPQTSKNQRLGIETGLRLSSSTEGRFTILDEKNKDSESFDEDSYTDTEGEEISQFSKSCATPCPAPNINQKLALSHNSLPLMRLSVSMTPYGRVRTAPEESMKKYKKGRWECTEWRAPEELNQPLSIQNNHKDKMEYRSQHPPLIHEDSIFSIDQYDDLDRENLPEFSKSPPGNSLEVSMDGPTRTSPKFLDTPTRNRLLAASPDFLSGRATPLEMQLHYGLERSLSGNGSAYLNPYSFEGRVGSPQSFRGSSVPPPDRSTGNAGNTGNSPIVAIDSKIEQAMDLVKTHLMFAVREEVELLRNKILSLETTIIQLEAENAVLREHVPAEVLQNLTAATSSPPPQPNTAVAAQ